MTTTSPQIEAETRALEQAQADLVAPKRGEILAPVNKPSASYFTSGQRLTHGWTPPARRADEDVRSAGHMALARAIDGLHNSGWLSGTIDVICAQTVGPQGLRANFRPDYTSLGWSAKEASDWANDVERRWKAWSTSPLECDVAGRQTIGQMTYQAYKWWYGHGEILASVENPKYSHARSRTKINMLDPLTLPRHASRGAIDQGIVTNKFGFPLGYLFREKRPGERAETERMVNAYARTGRRLVIHIFDGAPGQRRGITPLAPALKVVRQYDQLADATLTTTLLQTIFAATIKSDMPVNEVIQALQTEDESIEGSTLTKYLQESSAWYKNSAIDLGEHGRIAQLFPSEELNFHRSEHPTDNYDSFSKGLIREIARGLPATYETMSGDYRGATYSSVRMATAEHWPIILYRRHNVAAKLPQAAAEAWLEEEILRGNVPFKGGHRAFLANRSAACRIDWYGPARPTADDQKTTSAQIARVNNGLSTLQAECAENGLDWEEVLEQRAREQARARELDVVLGDNPQEMIEDADAQDRDEQAQAEI